ncbi:unnamed protein product [Penicillium viridicatum]
MTLQDSEGLAEYEAWRQAFDRELPQDQPPHDERFPDDVDRHDIAAVLDMRVRHLGRYRTPVREYLIQWEGEPREQSQWVKERDAVIHYNQQRGGDADPTTLANTSAEIPLGESVPQGPLLHPTHLNHPPVNAAGENDILITSKPDDPIAQERVRENTERLVDSGVATKLCTDRTLDASLLEQTETQGAP